MTRKRYDEESHTSNESVMHTDFDNASAWQIRRGDQIVERDQKGRIVRRATVTDRDLFPEGCTGRVHVSVTFTSERGFARAVWCYDHQSRVEIQ